MLPPVPPPRRLRSHFGSCKPRRKKNSISLFARVSLSAATAAAVADDTRRSRPPFLFARAHKFSLLGNLTEIIINKFRPPAHSWPTHALDLFFHVDVYKTKIIALFGVRFHHSRWESQGWVLDALTASTRNLPLLHSISTGECGKHFLSQRQKCFAPRSVRIAFKFRPRRAITLSWEMKNGILNQ